MSLDPGQSLAHYLVDRQPGEGGPPALEPVSGRELRRGLADAQPDPRP